MSGAISQERTYKVEVGSNVRSLRISLIGGTGDADLYVLRNGVPTRFVFDCRPFHVGNNETCAFLSPLPGTYHIMIRAYRDYRDASLSVLID